MNGVVSSRVLAAQCGEGVKERVKDFVFRFFLSGWFLPPGSVFKGSQEREERKRMFKCSLFCRLVS